MQAVAVFCGSKPGNHPLYLQHAKQLGKALAQAQKTLVYGGGNKGLMGAVATAALDAGGKVVGIIPERLRSFEHQHEGLTELVVVPDMHTRKRLMYERCDAAVILAGGYGTMDELFEMLTWNPLEIHEKTVYMLNT
ncbi:MAG TPA: TIGR00730 family Rossman fold protein, partial [Phnomibacter sp.]|nr:TIGR00730 family Rossman fold protein [Phnomibacter sp.]